MEPFPPADLLEWTSMRLPCRIGVLPGESDRPQPLRVRLRLRADLTAATESGELGDTLDYARISEQVRAVVEDGPWTLLEKLAGEILREVTRDPRVMRASVRLTKDRPPLGPEVGPISVEIERGRNSFWS